MSDSREDLEKRVEELTKELEKDAICSWSEGSVRKLELEIVDKIRVILSSAREEEPGLRERLDEIERLAVEISARVPPIATIAARPVEGEKR